GKLETEEVIALLSVKPREILGIEVPVIKTGAMANITLFDPDKVWRFEEADIRSRSANTPFIGNEFVGKALGIYNQGQLWLHA
ncbi:MAG: dihydroorotase, partial [Flavobacteriales bacterium]